MLKKLFAIYLCTHLCQFISGSNAHGAEYKKLFSFIIYFLFNIYASLIIIDRIKFNRE